MTKCFDQKQKKIVINELELMGWTFKNDIITSPSQGLFFNESHFEWWTPNEMYKVIDNRGKRVAKEKHNGWKQFSEEHFQVCKAIEKMWKYYSLKPS